ncbi:hypothetical protein IJ531_04460 [bacterium]|nr:hypothetical protein [bacterium]
MQKVLILSKLCWKFSKKYFVSYISELSKPIMAAILGILLLAVVFIDTKFILCGFLSIPCFCYAFWKGYVITYGLIPCAYNFIKESAHPFKQFSLEAKMQETNLAKYVCFIAAVSMILYVPSLIYIIKTVPFSIEMVFNQEKLLAYSTEIDNAFLINTLFLAPFLNYGLCAFYFKKEHENYFKLFLNCYKNLDILGLIIALLITYIASKGSIIYLILALLVNLFVYSINTFWYLSRVEK